MHAYLLDDMYNARWLSSALIVDLDVDKDNTIAIKVANWKYFGS